MGEHLILRHTNKNWQPLSLKLAVKGRKLFRSIYSGNIFKITNECQKLFISHNFFENNF